MTCVTKLLHQVTIIKMRCSLKNNDPFSINCCSSCVWQVANGDIDHAWWGRPEEMPMSRPSYKITTSAPGSELAGETAAALAAASLVFRASDPTYADLLLGHARELYSFADQYRGLYHDSITDAAKFYR